MSKIDNSTIQSNYTTLDTLEVTSEIFKSKSAENLYRYALRKYRTNEKVKLLFDVSGNKDYWKPFHCNEVLLQQGKSLKGSLCRTRYCNHCQRIKTAELIKGYQAPLIKLTEEDKLYFVTLTAPTVKGRQLKAEIVKRYKAWNRVKDRLRKQGLKINGIRKLEVEYNDKKDWFHPHFHLICQGKKESELLLKYWLEDYTTADIKGQNIKEVGTTAKDLIELFKYTTKDIVKDKATAEATHTIYQSLKGKRVFQTYGKIRKVKEPTEAQTESIVFDHLKDRNEIWAFDMEYIDWTTAYNEKLIGTLDIKNQIHENYVNSRKR